MDLDVFVVDDDEAMRDSLVFLFRAEGFRSRAYASAEDFLAQLRPDHNGCVVTDVRMPGMDGIELVRVLNAMKCAMPTIVITGHGDVPLAVQAMKEGAADFIEKPCDSKVIVQAVRSGLERARTMRTVWTHRQGVEARLRSLTPRERQVLDLLADGHANKQIAAALGISPRTVELHRARVMAKMQASSLSELVRAVLATAM